MTDGVTIDIWNEPDGGNFWAREQSQYLQMWGHGSARFRSELPGVPLSGPSAAYEPSPTNSWWNAWASYAVTNKSLPDVHAWHSLRALGTTEGMLSDYSALLANYNATRDGPVNINEYGAVREQTPTGDGWWIAQLERANIYGCRANWASAYALHDFFAQLLGKPNAGTDDYDPEETGYWPTAEYQVYKYYVSMGGERVRTEATEDAMGDVYATVEGNVVKVLAGTRVTEGTWAIEIEGLGALGLPAEGSVDIHTYEFPGSEDVYARVDRPTDLGVVRHNYEGDRVTFSVYSVDVYTTWAFEIEF